MDISITSGEYKVLQTGTVAAFHEDSDMTFHFVDNDNFRFDLKLTFKKDETGKQIINRNVEGKELELECINFNDGGTGTSNPIPIATFHGEIIYFRFWSYLDGDYPGQNKTRKVEYTFYIGK